MTKAYNITVTLTRTQAVRVAGNLLGSVSPGSGYLVVNRKRPKEEKFATYFYPLGSSGPILAHNDGEGGENGAGYVILLEDVVLVQITGKGSVVDGWVRVQDAHGRLHSIQCQHDDPTVRVTVVEKKEEVASKRNR